MLPRQVYDFVFDFLFNFIKELFTFVGDLVIDVFNFFLLHKLQKWFQVLHIKKCYHVVAKSAHLSVSQEPLLVFKSLIVGRIFLNNSNLLQPLILLIILWHCTLPSKFFWYHNQERSGIWRSDIRAIIKHPGYLLNFDHDIAEEVFVAVSRFKIHFIFSF